MPIRRFRVVVLISWLVLLASYVLPEYFPPSDPGLARLARYDGYGAMLRGNFVLCLAVGDVIRERGLFLLSLNWGRYLYLAGVASQSLRRCFSAIAPPLRLSRSWAPLAGYSTESYLRFVSLRP